jgi:DNA-binding transcriptional LysR family regulator
LRYLVAEEIRCLFGNEMAAVFCDCGGASLSRGGMLSLCRRKTVTEISVRPKLTTNNAQVLVDSLVAGRGIGTAQVLLVGAGKLIRVLADYEIKPTELFLVYPSAKFLRSTVRAFIDFAMPALQGIDGIA